MIEQIIKNVLNAMTPHLDPEQIEHLGNILYVNFHGKTIQEDWLILKKTGMRRGLECLWPARLL